MISSVKRGLMAALFVAVAFGAASNTATAQDRLSGLFINLTTDDTWSAAKAVFFAQRAMSQGIEPVVIWMNVRAVYLAMADRPSDVPGALRDADQSLHDMLQAFMDNGGVVIMCQACSHTAGLTLDDYIDGVVMGNWAMVSGYLFDPMVQTLAW